MNILLLLIPVALFLGGLGLLAFVWAMRSGQFDDMEGAAMRILIDEEMRPMSGHEGQTSGGVPAKRATRSVAESES